jgi:hypothetical protein
MPMKFALPPIVRNGRGGREGVGLYSRGFGILICLAFYAGLLLFNIGGAHAVEFSMCAPSELKPNEPESDVFPRCGGALWISGTIKPGDYERFREYLREHIDTLTMSMGATRSVVLYGVDGNEPGEAIQIGQLVRRLEMMTEVGSVYEDNTKTVAWNIFTSESDDVYCRESCVLIWVGGKPRLGTHGLVLNHLGDDPAIDAYLHNVGLPHLFLARWRQVQIDGSDPLQVRYVFYNLMNAPSKIEESCAGRPLKYCPDKDDGVRLFKLIEKEFGG